MALPRWFAGAVEGLESSEVTVLDTRGNVLSTGGG